MKRREESEYGVSDEIAGALTIKMGDPTERPCALTNVVSASRTRRRIGISLLVLWTTATALARQPGTVQITGALTHPMRLTAADLAALPRRSVTASARHLTGTWEGVEVRELLTRAGVPAGEALRGRALATAVTLTGADGYRVVLGIAELDPAFTDRVAILADRKDGAALTPNAGPFQLIITGEKRPARWVRQVVAIELTSLASREP